jgi:hypothetical protein
MEDCVNTGLGWPDAVAMSVAFIVMAVIACAFFRID